MILSPTINTSINNQLFNDRVSYSLGWPQTHCIAKGMFDLAILLPHFLHAFISTLVLGGAWELNPRFLAC